MSLSYVSMADPKGEIKDILCIGSGTEGAVIISLPYPPFPNMVFSIWAKSETETTASALVLGKDASLELKTNWKRYEITIPNPTDTEVIIEPSNSTSIYICMAQLEEGKIASDWRPAPEDVDSDIESLEKDLSSLDGELDALQIETVNTINTIKALSVGGVNMVDNSAEIVITGTYTDSESRRVLSSELQAGTVYTLSIESAIREAGNAIGMTFEVVRNSDQTVILSHVMDYSLANQKYTFTTADDGWQYSAQIYSGIKGSTNGTKARLVHAKLEKGTFATMWNESRTDSLARVRMLESSLNFLKGKMSFVTQFATGSYTDENGTTYVEANNLQSQMGVIHSFFNFNAHPTQPTLTIGTTASSLSMRLSNQELAFYQDNIKLAYFTNSKLFIPNAETTTSISIGNATNGYLTLSTTNTGVGFTWQN